MKVNGQLERAQMEQFKTGFPSGSHPTARFGADTQNAARALPGFYDGTEWKQLAFSTTTNYPSKNSGKNVTIDWNDGLIQVLILTDNCLVSFSNPKENMNHTLIVKQAGYSSISPVLTSMFQYILNMKDQETRLTPYQPAVSLPQSGIAVHKWQYKTAIKPAADSFVPRQQTPAWGAALSALSGISVAPAGDIFCGGATATPFTSWMTYGQTPYRPIVGPSNSPLAPTAAVAAVTSTAIAPDGLSVAYTSGTSPFVQLFAVSTKTGTPMTVAPNPGTLPTGAGQCSAWHPTATHLAVGHATSPFLSVYPVNAENSFGFGTKLTNPATLPAAQVNAVAFSPLGDFLTVASQTTPFIQTYLFDKNAVSVGTIVLDPPTLPAGGPAQGGKAVAWRPQGDYIAMGMSVSPYLYVVPFDRNTASYSLPLLIGTPPGAAVTSVQWTPDGEFLLVGTSVSPYLLVYDFGSKTIGSPMGYDFSPPGVAIRDIAVLPSGDQAILATGTTPFVMTQKLPTRVKNYLKLTE